MEIEATTQTSSKAIAIKAVAERGSKAATDVIALEYQSLVGDFAFSVADRAAFTVAVLNQLEEFITTKLVVKQSVVSPAGYAIIRTHALECSKGFALLQDTANSIKRAYRRAERDRNGKTDQWTCQGLEWPLIKAQLHQSSEALESPTRELLMILNIVKLAHARLLSEKYFFSLGELQKQEAYRVNRFWDENITRHQQALQRAIVALYTKPKNADEEDCKTPTRLHDIVEEISEDSQKSKPSLPTSGKTLEEKVSLERSRTDSKTAAGDREVRASDSKDDTAVSIYSRRSVDTETIAVLRSRNIFHR